MPRTVAIVEDETPIRENYADALRRQGYRVQTFANREHAMGAFRSRLPDLVLLDIALQDEIDAGFEMCRELRTLSSKLPIIFLTARDSDYDSIAGLRVGADDYITKDVSIPHIIARISALFRRVEALGDPTDQRNERKCGELTIDPDRVIARWTESVVDLTLTEFWIVNALTKNPGHVKTREQLMSDANVVVDDTTVTSHIKRIRRKFKAIDVNFDSIETVYGMGYRWT
ncbi:MAG: proteobacterial dedicated sortase system response regulator [Proteobacteria bacterium]|nr:proteobacterial dedicated sortase system response regulator [Pseudomonadota bacterium]